MKVKGLEQQATLVCIFIFLRLRRKNLKIKPKFPKFIKYITIIK